jgi:hypothetical protein
MRTPVTPTATPVKMPESSTGLSPEIRYQMENAGTWTTVTPTTPPKTSDGLSPDIQSQTENVAGTATSPVSGTWLSPEIKYQIENASPATARHVALRMYKSLKRHGLQDEAGKAFGREGAEIEEAFGREGAMKTNMQKQKHDRARITPPIPQQVP